MTVSAGRNFETIEPATSTSITFSLKGSLQ
jgi:hypothetical protein